MSCATLINLRHFTPARHATAAAHPPLSRSSHARSRGLRAAREQLQIALVPRSQQSSGEPASSPEDSSSSSTEASVQLPMPRRSRQVSFTCNNCDGRTTKLVNPLAWDKGLVFVQCAKCDVWHNLRDNQGLVEEIRFGKDGEEVAHSVGNDLLHREQ